MAAPSSPSKLVSSTNLSLSNSSPWRLKVTVEAEADSDIFLDLAEQESLTIQNTSKRARKPKDQNASKTTSRKVILPVKGADATAVSEDSLGLDNTTGIFAADCIDATIPRPTTPRRGSAQGSRTPNAIKVPLKGSEPKSKQPKRKGTPARKKTRDVVDLSASEPETAPQPTTTTPKRGRGRPRKSVGNLTEIEAPQEPRYTIPATHNIPVTETEYRMDIGDRSAPPEDTFMGHIPSPPSSPGSSSIRSRASRSPDVDMYGEDQSVVASEGFSMIAPRVHIPVSIAPGLNTPRPTPEAEERPERPAAAASKAVAAEPKNTRLQSPSNVIQTEVVEEVADDVAALSIQPGRRRRRSLRLASKPGEGEQIIVKPTATSTVIDRFRELASKASKGATGHGSAIQPASETGEDVSSFRRFLESEPAKVVPGTYEESTVYFARGRPVQIAPRRKQTPAKKASFQLAKESQGNSENIIPEHLLGPVKPGDREIKDVTGVEILKGDILIADTREGTPDLFGEEGRSVRWHEDVQGGSFSLNSSSLNSNSMEKPEPITPQQESSHRLLENEIIVEPFRPNAGKLKDGSVMPLVVPKEWTNRYWAVLTEMAFPDIDLVLRSQRPMGALHPKESPEQAMERRKKILKSFPRNSEGHLILSEHDSTIIDTFEEHMRREIVGEKRIAGETRRMWGFSRNQIKEALVVLQVSRQRRIQWIVSAGERLEDWGLA
ncbi:hypothetical protein TWF694_011849 [Orbilia ellipsospora]|uniref:Uncharacterized protein n=1 Tax=Orbilia ellipsospora TaxID=2528407 RepID=A0AAV9X7M3_9PEZI